MDVVKNIKKKTTHIQGLFDKFVYHVYKSVCKMYNTSILSEILSLLGRENSTGSKVW